METQTNPNQLLDTTFMVYNNCDLEVGKREQSKEKQQTKIMAAIIGDALPEYPKSIQGNLGIEQRTVLSLCQTPAKNVRVPVMIPGTGGLTASTPTQRLHQAKL
ncbi:hypothetical protein AAY473_034029 [Plecturocebus cupreus]